MLPRLRCARIHLLSVITLALAVLIPRCVSEGGRVATNGRSGISAQMAFLNSDDTVIFLDKTEINPLQINGRPAWASEYNIRTGKSKPFDIVTNTFCAGGAPIADGRMVVTGGNIAVGPKGLAANQSVGPYFSIDGGMAVNIWNPRDGTWDSRPRGLHRERWYPSMEPLADGSVAIIGGQSGGGYSAIEKLMEPTLEFFPDRGAPVPVPIITRTLPMNLYPLTYLMSNGRMFIQSYNEAVLYDLSAHTEQKLPDKPGAPGPYPSNAAVTLLPFTPDTQYEETVLFCGGLTGLSKVDWGGTHGPNVSLTDKSNSRDCWSIAPLIDATWRPRPPAPEGRSMATFITLPDGKIAWIGGAKKGTAGYGPPGSTGQPIGHSYADDPGYAVWVLDPTRYTWSYEGTLSKPRMYHSSMVLMPDGSIVVGGSNPNPDVTTVKYPTEYSIEVWYPPWYITPRPSNAQLPTTFSYGSSGFRIDLTKARSANSTASITKATVRLIRTGFSTHAVQWGQRTIELKCRITNGSSTLVVDGLPNNRNLFAPGTALAFLDIDGVPSKGKFVQVGPKTITGERRKKRRMEWSDGAKLF